MYRELAGKECKLKSQLKSSQEKQDEQRDRKSIYFIISHLDSRCYLLRFYGDNYLLVEW